MSGLQREYMEHTTSIAHTMCTVDYKGKMKGPITARGFCYICMYIIIVYMCIL